MDTVQYRLDSRISEKKLVNKPVKGMFDKAGVSSRDM